MSKPLRAALVLCCVLFLSCAPRDDGAAFSVALVGLDGNTRVLGTLPVSVFAPRVSPDGRQLAFELRETSSAGTPAGERIWVAPLEQPGRRTALPHTGGGRNWAPLWTRDGRRLVFLVSSAEGNALWWRAADGSGEAERLVEGLSAEDSTADGRHITFITQRGDRDYGISMLDLQTRAVQVLVDREGSEQHSSTLSPDGRWLAYASNETGQHEIWLEPLPQTGTRHRLTRGGGSHPLWAPDGRSLYFERGSQLYRLAFEVDDAEPQASGPGVGEPRAGEPRVGEPQMLPIRDFQQGYRRRQFDVMPDGRHFLMLYPPGALGASP